MYVIVLGNDLGSLQTATAAAASIEYCLFQVAVASSGSARVVAEKAGRLGL